MISVELFSLLFEIIAIQFSFLIDKAVIIKFIENQYPGLSKKASIKTLLSFLEFKFLSKKELRFLKNCLYQNKILHSFLKCKKDAIKYFNFFLNLIFIILFIFI